MEIGQGSGTCSPDGQAISDSTLCTELEPRTSSADEKTIHEPTSAALCAELDPTTSSAKVVLDKLECLDVARKAERERRREESRAAADPRESVTRFLKNFAAGHRNVEDALQRMLASHQGQMQQEQQQQPFPSSASDEQHNPQQPQAVLDDPGTPELTPLAVSTATSEAIQASLELVSAKVLSLERAAAAASYYLPAYDQKQCAATVATLRASIEAARAALVPRRRFAFGSKKVSKVRGEEISAAAAATTASSHPAGCGAVPVAAGAGTAARTLPAARPSEGAMYEPGRVTASAALLSGHAATADPSAAAAPAVAAAGDDDVDAPAALTVSEQDRALVAQGRGLLGLTDETVVLHAEEVSERGTGGDFVLLGLTRCRVVLLGRLRALRVAGLRSCTVVSGPVTGACFVDDVRTSRLSLATYQVRVHRTHSTDLFLRVRSKPIIEHSTGIRVAPWAAAVALDPQLEHLLQAHMLGEETGCWRQVDDFGWIKAVQSPNWRVMLPEEYPREPMAVPAAAWQQPGAQPAAGDHQASLDSNDRGAVAAAPQEGKTDEL